MRYTFGAKGKIWTVVLEDSLHIIEIMSCIDEQYIEEAKKDDNL